MPHSGHDADRALLDPPGICFDKGQSECVGELTAAEDDRTADLVQVPEGAVRCTVGIDGGFVVPVASQPNGMAVPTVLGRNYLEPSFHVEEQDLGVELRQGWFGRKLMKASSPSGKTWRRRRAPSVSGLASMGRAPGDSSSTTGSKQCMDAKVPGLACSASRMAAPPQEWPKA